MMKFIKILLLVLIFSSQTFGQENSIVIKDGAKLSVRYDQSPTLLHFLIIGQSQAGGTGSTPPLSTTADPDVLTITGGPVNGDYNTGELIPLVEGNSGEFPETMATSLGQQLKALVNNPNYKYCVTIHHWGGSSIQDLDQGGANATYGHDDAVNAMIRVKDRAVNLGYSYERHFIITHGGSGVNPYATGTTSIINNLIANSPVGSNTNPFIWQDQQRVIGSPDYGEQLFDLQSAMTNYKLTIPRQDVVAILPDGVHMTNYGTRHNAMYFALSIYDDLFKFGSTPLIIDIDNVYFDEERNSLIVPILGAVGALHGTGDYNILVHRGTNGTEFSGSWSIDGKSIRFTFISPVPSGQTIDVYLEVAFGRSTGSLMDSRSNADIIFNDSDGQPYSVNKVPLRKKYVKAISFPSI